jgi:hypothetical protein
MRRRPRALGRSGLFNFQIWGATHFAADDSRIRFRSVQLLHNSDFLTDRGRSRPLDVGSQCWHRATSAGAGLNLPVCCYQFGLRPAVYPDRRAPERYLHYRFLGGAGCNHPKSYLHRHCPQWMHYDQPPDWRRPDHHAIATCDLALTHRGAAGAAPRFG